MADENARELLNEIASGVNCGAAGASDLVDEAMRLIGNTEWERDRVRRAYESARRGRKRLRAGLAKRCDEMERLLAEVQDERRRRADHVREIEAERDEAMSGWKKVDEELERVRVQLRAVQDNARRYRKEADGRKAHGERLSAEVKALRAAQPGNVFLYNRAYDAEAERDRLAEQVKRGLQELAAALLTTDGMLIQRDGIAAAGHRERAHGIEIGANEIRRIVRRVRVALDGGEQRG